MENYERMKLSSLCLKSYLPQKYWNNKYSFAGQRMINSVYQCLSAGYNYYTHPLVSDDFIVVEFLPSSKHCVNLSKVRAFDTKVIEITSDSLHQLSLQKNISFEYLLGIDFKQIPLIGYLPSEKIIHKHNIGRSDWSNEPGFHALIDGKDIREKNKSWPIQSVFNFFG
jgi:hypothetical protein